MKCREMTKIFQEGCLSTSKSPPPSQYPPVYVVVNYENHYRRIINLFERVVNSGYKLYFLSLYKLM